MSNEPTVENTLEAFRAALEGIESDSLRALVGEQLIHFVTGQDPRSSKIAALGLMSSTDALTRDVGRKIISMSQPGGAVDIGRSRLDLIIITPKEEELKACLSVFGIEGEPNTKLGDDVELWTWQHGPFRAGLYLLGTDGNVEAAIEVQRVYAQFPFRAAVLVGMAAGLEGEVRKGDIVVASWVVAYEFARVTKGRYRSRAKAYPADLRSVQRVARLNATIEPWVTEVSRSIRNCSSFRGIESGDPEKLTTRWRPKVKTGVVLAGSRLIEDGSLAKLKDEINDRSIAAEMEGAGFAAACTAMRIPWLVIRGIADYGKADESLNRGASGGPAQRRGKSWQFPSTYVAAAYVRDMVLGRKLPLLAGPNDDAGWQT